MSERTEFVVELAGAITDRVNRAQWASVEADLTAISEQIAQVLMETAEEDLAEIYQAIERAYSTLVTKCRVDDGVSDAKSAAAELRAYTRLLSVALQHRRAPGMKEVALDDTYRPLLEKLFRAPHGMSGRELAEVTGTRPETIARKLPTLRETGLIRSQQVGKAMINNLTDEGRRLLDREKSINAMTESQRGNIVAAKRIFVREGRFTSALRRAKRPQSASKAHEVQVVGAVPTRETKSIADLITKSAERLAQINDAVGQKPGPIEDLTIHFFPDARLVVANLESKDRGESDVKQLAKAESLPR